MRLVILSLALLLPCTRAGAVTWHVPSQCPTIQAGIYRCAEGDTVVVACGVYHQHDIEIDLTICLRSETGQPDCVTIDGQGQGRVLYCLDSFNTSHIEGFTITGGAGVGGGLYCSGASATVTNCVFSGNSTASDGGAVNLWWCSPAFHNCTFSGNSARWGGAINCPHSSLTLTHCVFSGNSAEDYGGAVECYANSSAVISDCVFFGNSAGERGGAFNCSQQSTLTLHNCTLSENSAPLGAAIACWADAHAVFENTVVAFGAAGEAAYCEIGGAVTPACCDVFGNAGGDWVGCIAGQNGMNGNISEDPLFCDGCLNLQECSPCVEGYGCGQIGAYGAGCPCGGGPSAVEQTSWSSLKFLYR